MPGIQFLLLTAAVFLFPFVLYQLVRAVGCVVSGVFGTCERRGSLGVSLCGALSILAVSAVASQQDNDQAGPKAVATATAATEQQADEDVSATVSEQQAAKDATQEVADPKTDGDPLIVMTRKALKNLIDESGGDSEAFDLETIQQAYTLIPMPLSQPNSLRPFLRAAVNPVVVRQIFQGEGLQTIRNILDSETDFQTQQEVESALSFLSTTEDELHIANPWITDPGIGMVVAETEFIESNRTAEIADAVQQSIREAVSQHVEAAVKKKYGVAKLTSSTLDLSAIDFSEAVQKQAIELVDSRKTGNPEDVMVKTYVLVDVPKDQAQALTSVVKQQIQTERLALVAGTVILLWLGIAFSSVAFRSFHAESKTWRLVVVPLMSLAVVPCLLGAIVVVAEMVTGKLL